MSKELNQIEELKDMLAKQGKLVGDTKTQALETIQALEAQLVTANTDNSVYKLQIQHLEAQLHKAEGSFEYSVCGICFRDC